MKTSSVAIGLVSAVVGRVARLLPFIYLGAVQAAELPVLDGFSGIWYAAGEVGMYGPKYGGGMATYPQQHEPIAVYSAAARKTFFVFGAVDAADGSLQYGISYFDHATKLVARPRLLLDRVIKDAHANPTLQIDADGTLWVFGPVHGNQDGPATNGARLFKSDAPLSIAGFSPVPLPVNAFPQKRFSYPQPWYLAGQGFLLLFSRYGVTGGPDDHELYWTTSRDGLAWTDLRHFATIDHGDYQVSWRWQGAKGSKVGTAFDRHPVDLDSRTDLYYLETRDLGATWTTASGQAVATPVVTRRNPALVKNYAVAHQFVFLKDVNFDASGRPAILYLTSPTNVPGPLPDGAAPRTVRVARWNGRQWIFHVVTTTDHNYDHGSLSIDADGLWRIVGTFRAAQQPWTTGGRLGEWVSHDRGESWAYSAITPQSVLNQNYPRRPLDAQADFYALWADGDGMKPSPSHLFFTDQTGRAVYQLPTTFTADFAPPLPVADP